MSYCPECGTKMEMTENGTVIARYVCAPCDVTWEYSAEEGAYRVVEG